MRAGTTLGVVPALIASIHRPSHEGAVTPSDSTLTTQLPEGVYLLYLSMPNTAHLSP